MKFPSTDMCASLSNKSMFYTRDEISVDIGVPSIPTSDHTKSNSTTHNPPTMQAHNGPPRVSEISWLGAHTHRRMYTTPSRLEAKNRVSSHKS